MLFTKLATPFLLIGLAVATPTPAEAEVAEVAEVAVASPELPPMGKISHQRLRYCKGINMGVGCTDECFEYDKWAEGIVAPGGEWNWMNHIKCIETDAKSGTVFSICDKYRKGCIDPKSCRRSEELKSFNVGHKKYYETIPGGGGRAHFLFIHHSEGASDEPSTDA